MTREEFLAGVRARLDWPDLGPETPLKGNEKWDSLAQVDVVMYVQDELGETLNTNQLQEAATAGDLLALVSDRLG
jgi:acyl carrier protein